MRSPREGPPWLLAGTVATLVLAVLVLFFPLVNVLVIAGSFAAVLVPYHRTLSRHMPAPLSSALITGSVILALIAVLFLAGETIAANTGYIQHLFTTIAEWVAGMTGGGGVSSIVDMGGIGDAVIDWVKENITALLGQGAYYAIMVVILFLFQYLLTLYGDRIYREVWSRIPRRSREGIGALRTAVADTLYSLFIVHVAVSAFVFIAAVPFFIVLGYGHVLFWSVTCAVLALFPVIGPEITIAFLAVYALAIGDYRGLALILLIGWPLIGALPDWYLRPVLMGKRAKMNAVLIFIAFFGGIAILGLVGFVYGPLALAVITASYHVFLTEVPPETEGDGTGGTEMPGNG